MITLTLSKSEASVVYSALELALDFSLSKNEKVKVDNIIAQLAQAGASPDCAFDD
jgi:hypothetical protein